MLKGMLHLKYLTIMLLVVFFMVGRGFSMNALAEPHAFTASPQSSAEPAPLSIQAPDGVTIPIYLVGDTLFGKTVNYYLWVDVGSDSYYITFTVSGNNLQVQYHSFADEKDMAPFAQGPMPYFAQYDLPLLSSTAGLPQEVEATVHFCVDPNTSALFNEKDATCGTRVVDLKPDQGTSTLTVTLSGSGTVSASPTGLTWNGSTGTQTYPDGTKVTLTATPSSGSTFSGWSGGCSGTSNTCTVTMDSAKSVKATFSSTQSGGCNVLQTMLGLCGSGGGTTTQQATSVIASPSTVSLTVTSGQTASGTVYVKDNLGNYLQNFTATPVGTYSWLTLENQGSYGLQVKVGPITAAVSGDVKITSGSLTSATLHISATPDICTPQSSPVITPARATGTAAPGGSYTFTVSVTDGCSPLPFTLTCDSSNAANDCGNIDIDNTQVIYTVPAGAANNSTYTGNVNVTVNDTIKTIPITVTVSTPPPASTGIIVLSKWGGQKVDFNVPANKAVIFQFQTSVNNFTNPNPLEVGLTNTATWETGQVDLLVKYVGRTCDSSKVPTMSDLAAARNYLATNTGQACEKGTEPGCTGPAWSTPVTANGPYYYYRIALNSSDELVDVTNSNPNWIDYPDRPAGCYYFMVGNPGSTDKTISMMWSDLDWYYSQ